MTTLTKKSSTEPVTPLFPLNSATKPPIAATTGNKPSQFDENLRWWDENPEAVVFHEQPATALYFNQRGDLVIRQRDWFADDEPCIVIAASNIGEFLDRLTDVCGVPSVGRRE